MKMYTLFQKTNLILLVVTFILASCIKDSECETSGVEVYRGDVWALTKADGYVHLVIPGITDARGGYLITAVHETSFILNGVDISAIPERVTLGEGLMFESQTIYCRLIERSAAGGGHVSFDRQPSGYYALERLNDTVIVESLRLSSFNMMYYTAFKKAE